MSIMISLLLAAAPTVAELKDAKSGPVYNQPVPAGKISTANPHSIVAYLQQEGYRAKLLTGTKGDPYIESAGSGATFSLYLQNCKKPKGCEDLMFQSSYAKKETDPVKLDQINKYNADHRWARAYLDDVGDPVIEYDVLFTEQLVDEKMFGEALTIWLDSLSKFHKAIGF